MSLAERLNNDLKQALLDRHKDAVDLLRLIKAALQNEAISLKSKELKDDQVIKVLKREAKKRQDSITQFTQGNRPDLADKEKHELELIKPYLPEEMSSGKVKEIVAQVIQEMGEVSPSQFGAVMGAVMQRTQGQADGALVSRTVKEALK